MSLEEKITEQDNVLLKDGTQLFIFISCIWLKLVYIASLELVPRVTSTGSLIINHPPGNFTFQSHFEDVGSWKDFHFIK